MAIAQEYRACWMYQAQVVEQGFPVSGQVFPSGFTKRPPFMAVAFPVLSVAQRGPKKKPRREPGERG